MQSPHPQREGQVTKLPAIFGFLPSMENINKTPADLVARLNRCHRSHHDLVWLVFFTAGFWLCAGDINRKPQSIYL